MNTATTKFLKDYSVLIAILSIATILRVISLNNSLWYDEILTVVDSIRLPYSELLLSYSSFNNHPLYSLIAKTSVSLFGETSWSVRLPALLFGIASLAALWKLIQQNYNLTIAHTVTLLAALSYHHIWFSQNARGYTAMMFWCMLSTVLLINCLKKPKWGIWLSYGLTIAAGIYTHLTASIYFLAQAICVLLIIIRRNGWLASHYSAFSHKQWLMPLSTFGIAGLLILIAYLPSIANIYNMVIEVPETSAIDVMKEYQSPLWAALEMIRSVASISPLTIGVALLSACLIGIGVVSSMTKAPLLPAIFLLHILLMIVMLASLSMRIWPRFFFVDAGLILLFMTQGVYICCQGIADFIPKIRLPSINKNLLFGIATALMALISLQLATRNYQFPKQDFDSSIQYISNQAIDSDSIVAFGLTAVPFIQYYQKPWTTVSNMEELKLAESSSSDTWVIIIFPTRTFRQHPASANYLQENFELKKQLPGTLGDGQILIFHKAHYHFTNKANSSE